MNRLKTKWTSHLKDPEEKKEFKEGVLRSEWLLERIVEYCEGKIEHNKPGKPNYENGSWSHEMADHIGYERALQDIIDFCTITE